MSTASIVYFVPSMNINLDVLSPLRPYLYDIVADECYKRNPPQLFFLYILPGAQLRVSLRCRCLFVRAISEQLCSIRVNIHD